MGPYNGSANPDYDLAFLATCCFKGDLDTLDALLFSDDKEKKFAGDISAHATDMTPLMFAVSGGQIEVVELMLKARADPHMKCRMPYGKDPADGENAREIAVKCGFPDIVQVLQKAEEEIPPHRYKRYGANNNSRLELFDTGETGAGKDPFAEMKRADYVPGHVVKKAPALPRTSIALLFPGQGSQYVKMLTEQHAHPEVMKLVEIANRVMGYDLLEICLRGPEDRLEETSVCQPALFLASMAGRIKLRQLRPEAADRPEAVAGLSLGEYTALCVAGVFTFEQGMELVKIRGEGMAAAAKVQPQAMISVAGLDQNTLEDLCAEQERAQGAVCKLANILFPKGFTCSGTKAAIEALQNAADKAGAMQTKMIKTSGAFHTNLMAPAAERLEAALYDLLPRMKPPTCDIYMNVTGKRMKAGTPPAEFVPLLAKQLVSPVLWEASVSLMIRDGLSEFYEVGPMKQLKAMMKRINPDYWSSTVNVEV